MGISFWKIGLFFPETKGSLAGLNAHLWVIQRDWKGSAQLTSVTLLT